MFQKIKDYFRTSETYTNVGEKKFNKEVLQRVCHLLPLLLFSIIGAFIAQNRAVVFLHKTDNMNVDGALLGGMYYMILSFVGICFVYICYLLLFSGLWWILTWLLLRKQDDKSSVSWAGYFICILTFICLNVIAWIRWYHWKIDCFLEKYGVYCILFGQDGIIGCLYIRLLYIVLPHFL